VLSIAVVETSETADVELPVGNDGPALSVEVTGTTVVMMIGGSPTGEIVNSTVVDSGGSLVADEKLEELIEVLVAMGGSVAEKICEVEALTEIEVTPDSDVEVREVERPDEEADVVDRDPVTFAEEPIELSLVVTKEE
jgi:hypothetical protein